MYDSRSWTNPARDRARRQMELVKNLHLVHLTIVTRKDEMHLLEFEDADYERMIGQTIPAFIRDTGGSSAIVSSPAKNDLREGVNVAIMERMVEIFYVPIVRITNADVLIGDFRPTNAVDPNGYGPIFEALMANWIERDNGKF